MENEVEKVPAKIAIIDDNKDQRESNAIRLRLFLKKLNSDILVVDSFPFENYGDYIGFLNQENIVALIVDEKLHNDSQVGKKPVGYNGSDLVVRVRETHKYLPIFTLTAFPEVDEIANNFNNYEYIINKNNFLEKHAEIIQRACQRYLIENERELSLFNELTANIASGKRTEGDFERLKALQIKLHIPLNTDLNDRADWLGEYETQIKHLEDVKKKLEAKISGK